MNFRKATDKDIGSLVLLFKELLIMHSEKLSNIFANSIDENMLKDNIENAMENKKSTFYIAEDKDKVVGAIEVINVIEENNPILKNRKYALIDKLVVDKGYRGHGIATSLIDHAENDLKNMGIRNIEIYVWEFNEGALSLYEKKGYKTICRRMSKSIDL